MSGRAGSQSSGFTIVELMITTLIMMAVMGAIFAIVIPAQATFQAQGEVADLHQRLRAAVEMLAADLRAASGVRPYRVGDVRDDALAGIYYRSDTISVLEVPSSALAADRDATRTYYVKMDGAMKSLELMQYDGRVTDLPVVEHVVRLSFEYLGVPPSEGSGLITLDQVILTDGPWAEDAGGRRFDRDLLRVHQVNIHLRFESTNQSMRASAPALFLRPGTSNVAERFVPDEEVDVHVAMRTDPEQK